MSAESLLTRFDGASGPARLKIALQDQVILCGNTLACDEVAQRCKLREVAANEILIRQDGVDNDIYFVLAGAFAVIVNGRRVALRRAGQHLGEMAIVDPRRPAFGHSTCFGGKCCRSNERSRFRHPCG